MEQLYEATFELYRKRVRLRIGSEGHTTLALHLWTDGQQMFLKEGPPSKFCWSCDYFSWKYFRGFKQEEEVCGMIGKHINLATSVLSTFFSLCFPHLIQYVSWDGPALLSEYAYTSNMCMYIAFWVSAFDGGLSNVCICSPKCNQSKKGCVTTFCGHRLLCCRLFFFTNHGSVVRGCFIIYFIPGSVSKR